MRDDTTRPLHSDPDDMDDQIDELLPIPEQPADAGHDDVDSAMDTLLPAPGARHHSPDDATTREELEVDTTVDGIDDRVDPSPQRGNDELDGHQPPDGNSPGETGPDTIEGVAVGAEIEADQASGHPDRVSYAPGSQADDRRQDDSEVGPTAADQPNVDSETGDAHQCLACGAPISSVAYCPVCGADQYPDTRMAAVFSPLLSWFRPAPVRMVMLVGAVLVVLALLADSGASALTIAAITLPVALLFRIAMQVQL